MIRVPQKVFDRLVVYTYGCDLGHLQDHHCTREGVWIKPPPEIVQRHMGVIAGPIRDNMIDVIDPGEIPAPTMPTLSRREESERNRINVVDPHDSGRYVAQFYHHYVTNEGKWLLPIIADDSVLSREDFDWEQYENWKRTHTVEKT